MNIHKVWQSWHTLSKLADNKIIVGGDAGCHSRCSIGFTDYWSPYRFSRCFLSCQEGASTTLFSYRGRALLVCLVRLRLTAHNFSVTHTRKIKKRKREQIRLTVIREVVHISHMFPCSISCFGFPNIIPQYWYLLTYIENIPPNANFSFYIF